MTKDYGHGDLSWFKHARFGMFIHYGLYSMPARHEWIKSHEKIGDEKYDVYFNLFDPDLFEPQVWAKAAKDAGMKYMVITSKHHEGFCLWDSKYTDYKITNTPFGRDMLREVVDAFRAEGIRIGFYYSLLDWHHPDFPIDCFHPLRDLPKEEVDALNAKRDIRKYQDYMIDQITELLTEFGKIDIIWFDFSYPYGCFPKDGRPGGKGHDDWDSERIVKCVRSLQPDIIIDNRLDLPGSGDIVTPEQYTPRENAAKTHSSPDENISAWEGCQTFSGSWGYYRDETTWKSAEQCIKMLIDHVSRDGNLLMNVGPCARGYLDKRAVNALDAYAEWMKYNSRSIYGCTMAEPEFKAPKGTVLTQSVDGKRLYIHFFSYPFFNFMMEDMAGKVKYAQFLHDGSEILYSEGKPSDMIGERAADNEKAIYFRVPTVQPDVLVPVIELILK